MADVKAQALARLAEMDADRIAPVHPTQDSAAFLDRRYTSVELMLRDILQADVRYWMLRGPNSWQYQAAQENLATHTAEANDGV